MNDIQLYIGDARVDLGNAANFAPLWTYTRDDADSPAAVKNSYTKTVTLPATPANDAIFGHMGRLDRRTVSGQFTPLARVPFTIYDAFSEIIDRGYAKLETIARRGPLIVSYDVTFYGGVGSLIYGLTFNDDGSRKTLADMYFPTDRSDEQSSLQARDIQIVINAAAVKAAWESLATGPDDTSVDGLLNWAPCFNGIPDQNFDAQKAYYKPGTTLLSPHYSGIQTECQPPDDEHQYDTRSDANGGVLIDLGTKVTEWEAQDLRANQQRPVIRLARILEALTLQDNFPGGGWTLALDPDFFRSDNPVFERAWLTLPVPQISGSATSLAALLAGTASPADYLVGFAKLMGLVFSPDPATGVVTLMSRDRYYNNGGTYAEPIDLSGRIDSEAGEKVDPFLMTARIYDFSQKGSAAFIDEYRERIGREYGAFLVDSGFMFDSATIDVLKGIPFKNAADVVETSPWFKIHGLSVQELSLKWAAYQLAKYQLFYEDSSTHTVDAVTLPVEYSYAHSAAYSLPSLLQFHDAAGKPTDGSDVLVFLCGMETISGTVEVIPQYVSLRKSFHLSDANAAMLALNNGIPCWNISIDQGVTAVTRIPVFRRWYVPTGSHAAVASFDLGVPYQVGHRDTEPASVTLYPSRWEKYIGDRFDVDALVLRARVDLSGLQVGPQLLRRFFWHRGSLWSLNKIVDYNPLSPGVTDCEFVRVKDPENYYNGQTLITA